MLPVDTTQYRNTYQLLRPVNWIVPYSLCLGIQMAIIALGLYSMYQNDVAVADEASCKPWLRLEARQRWIA